MNKSDNSISLEEASLQRGVSKRRINQQATEGGWGVRKIGRKQYLLSEDEERTSVLRSDIKISDQQRLDYENEIRDRLDQIQDPCERIQLICILAEMELDRLRPKEKWPEFDNDDGDLNNEEIDWLLSNCYQVGLISGKDLVAMGNSIKKSFKALKTIGSLDDLILEESAWSFMALDSILGMLENPESRRGSHGKDCMEYKLAKEKILISVTEAIVKLCAKPSDLN